MSSLVDQVAGQETSLCCNWRRFRCPLGMIPVGMPADNGKHDEKADDIGNGDMPPVAKPKSDGPRFRVHVRESYPGRRAEPDHRSAEADRVGKIAPIVTALLEGKRRQRDIIENRRQKSKTKR